MTYLNLRKTYIPDMTKWESTGVTAPVYGSGVLRIGEYLYFYGGENAVGQFQNKIYRAPWSDSTNWTLLANTLPDALTLPRCCIIDNNIYFIGTIWTNGEASCTKIYSGLVSAPDVITATGSTIPQRRDNSDLFMDSQYLYLYYGHSGYSGYGTALRASIGNPTSWTERSITNALTSWQGSVACIDDRAYISGGWQALRYLQYFPTPFNGKYKYGYFVEDIDNTCPSWHIGNSLWITGKTDGLNMTEVNINGGFGYSSLYKNCLIANKGYTHASWIDKNGYCHYVCRTTSVIYRSFRKEVYAEEAPLDSSRALRAITVDGTRTSITRSQRLGFRSWLTNRNDMIL